MEKKYKKRLKFCHYYPYDEHDNRPCAEEFSKLEFDYFLTDTFYNLRNTRKEESIKEVLEHVPELGIYLDNPDVPIETKGLVVWNVWCCLNMSSCWPKIGEENKDYWLGYNKYTKEEYDKILIEKLDGGRHNGRYYDSLRYYKGEKQNPFGYGDIRQYYWALEEMWVNSVLDDEVLSQNYQGEFDYDFPEGLLNMDQKCPLGLRAFMYARYYDSGGRSKEGFIHFFDSYLHIG